MELAKPISPLELEQKREGAIKEEALNSLILFLNNFLQEWVESGLEWPALLAARRLTGREAREEGLLSGGERITYQQVQATLLPIFDRAGWGIVEDTPNEVIRFWSTKVAPPAPKPLPGLSNQWR